MGWGQSMNLLMKVLTSAWWQAWRESGAQVECRSRMVLWALLRIHCWRISCWDLRTAAVMFRATQTTYLHVVAIPHCGPAPDNGLSCAPVEGSREVMMAVQTPQPPRECSLSCAFPVNWVMSWWGTRWCRCRINWNCWLISPQTFWCKLMSRGAVSSTSSAKFHLLSFGEFTKFSTSRWQSDSSFLLLSMRPRTFGSFADLRMVMLFNLSQDVVWACSIVATYFPHDGPWTLNINMRRV